MAAGLGQVDSELLDTRKSVLSSCERGDLSELQRVLEESQLDIGSEQLDRKGQTALHIACANGHLHIAQYLVNEKECNVMVKDEYGHTPFILSMINKHWKIAEFLVPLAPSSDSSKKHIGLLHYGESLVAEVAIEAFTEYCSSGYFQLVKFVKEKYDIHISEICVQSALDNGHVDIALYLKFGERDASHIASQLNKAWASKQWDSVSFILKCAQKSGSHESIGLSSTGLDQLIEVVPFKTHAFNTACYKGYLEVVRYLHEKGLSSPTLEVLESTRFEGHLHIVHFLLKYCKCTKPDDISEIHVACIVGDEEKVTSLLASNGAKVLSTTDQCGINALHYASCVPKILTMIIAVITKENTSLFNTKDRILGNTPLHYAVLAGCAESVRLLLRAPECDINLVNAKGEISLHLACRQSDIMILEMLVRNEMCDLNVQNINGDTALHIAIKERMTVKYIKELTFHNSCNPSITNHDGMTPLQLALNTDQISAIKVLLQCANMQGLLHRAIHADRMSLLIMLIEMKECNINEVNHDHQTAIHVACTKKNMKYIQALIQQPTCDLSIQDGNGDTALHIAACSKWNSAEKIQYLVECDRCDPDITNKQGYTPLHTATVNSQFDTVRKLLNSTKCNPNIQDIHGNTALHLSIRQKSATGIEPFLMCDKVNINIKNKKGNTPLHVACTVENIEYIQKLTQQPTCDLSIQNDNGDTALHIAARSKWNRAEKIQYLVECDRCDPDITNKQGYTPLHTATVHNKLNSVRKLLNSTKCNPNIQDIHGNTALHLRICHKSATGIEHFLMCDKVDVNIQNEEGNTPLHIAVIRDATLYITKKLIGHPNCNPCITNHEGMTPLQLAFKTDQVSATEILLLSAKCSREDKAKAMQGLLHCAIHADRMPLFIMLIELKEFNVNEEGHSGQTPLHVACIVESMEYIQKLTQQPTCDLNIQDDDGDTALHIAVCSEWNSAEKIQCILDSGRCDTNITNKQGYTPLHTATVHNKLNSVRKLLNSTICNPNIQDIHGNTALHLRICHKSATGIEHFLMCDKVDVNIQNEEGNTPLHIAAITDATFYITKKLIGHPNCNPNITNHEGMTPLQLAFKTDQVSAIEVLLLSATEVLLLSATEVLLLSATEVLLLSATEVLLLSAKCSREDKAKAMQGLLHCAIRADRMPLFIMLIELKEFNVNEEGHSGQTPLHVACTVKSMEYIQKLTQQPTCDLDIQDDNGDTALHIAACSEWNSAEKIQCILDSGRCDPNITNKQGYTPLHTATVHNQLESVRKLLNSTKCNPNIQDIHGNTALHLSIHQMSATVIEHFLMCDKVDVNIQNEEGNAPLHVAVIRDTEFDIIEKLIGHPNCNHSITNHEGITPLQLAFKTDQVSATEILLLSATEVLLLSAKVSHEDKAKAMQGLLHSAIHADRMPLFIMLIELKEFNVNEEGRSGQTPLHVACIVESMEYIQKLTQQPTCDLDIQDDNGDTALHIAACSKWNSAEKIQCLLDSGRCDTNITNKQGHTPLHIATVNSQFDAIKILLNSTKCNPNIQDIHGNTALHLSMHQKSATGIEHFLMCDKVDVNIQNRQGDTPLHVAVKQGIPISVIEAIAHHVHCNVSIANNKAMTPLQLSVKMKILPVANIIINVKKCSRGDIKKMVIEDASDVLYNAVLENCVALVQALLQFQSEKVNMKYSSHGSRETPLHAACRKGYCDMIEVLLENGADVQAVDSSGDAPIHIACQISRFHFQSVKVNMKYSSHGSEETPLHAACRNGYCDMIEVLLKNGANVQAANSSGDAPIHIVCKKARLGHLEVSFHSKECDPNQQNAIHIACKNYYCDMIEKLLKNGAEVQAVDSNGDAPIHLVCKSLALDYLKILLCSKECDPNQQNANGDTPLHIICRVGSIDSIKSFVQALVSTPGINPEAVNNAGFIPIEMAGANFSVIKIINTFLKERQSSIQTYIKIFVVGNSGTGKSTLIKAVTTEASQLLKSKFFPKMKFINTSDVPPHTAGIVPLSFNSKHFGHAVLYDFAGQHEYYSSHAAVMENLILPTPPLFLLLIDISKPMEKIKEELVYWWQFINNLSQRAAAPPHVMFVASHKDKVRARGKNPQSIIDTVLKDSVTNISVSFKFEGSFPMDCRKLVSRGLTALLTQLNTTCQVLRQTADVGLHCHILKAFLTTTEFKELVVCQIFKIFKKIKSDEILLPQSSSQLIPLLSTLSDQGHILLLQNHTDVNKSWVILKPEVILAEVNGSIFAPDYFKEHFHNFAMSTGVVPLSKIREKFTEFHHEVIVEFLIHLEFCFRIKDKHTLEMITKNEVSLTNEVLEYREEYYFFPALVDKDNPKDICLPQETDMYQCGWFYKCGKEAEQLTTRFLHVLILRLAFSCEPPDDPTERESVILLRSCSVWKHGISWWTDDGIETIVEVGLQCRWVAVMMRCPDTHKVQCAELRSKVIAIVLKVKHDFCQAITMNEFLIAPSNLQYPFEERELTLYSMRKIASIVVEGKDFAKDVEGKKKPLDVHLLLPFEPYYKLGDLIGSFFTAEQSLNKEISQEWLEQIAIKCHKNLRDFETALQPNLIAYEKEKKEKECSKVGDSEVMKCVALFSTLKNSQKTAMKTWRDFEREFSRFSIFCGRNPMVTTTTLCS